jgi:hypothetical protein
MNDNTRVTQTRAWPTATAFVAAAGLVLSAAACGGAKGSGVAQLGSTAKQTSVPSKTSKASAPSDGALAFARCMRANGVPTYPDPNSSGELVKESLQQLGVSSAQFQTTQASCQHLLPSGGSSGTPEQRQQKLTIFLRIARCIRTHGYPNFPDPTGSQQSLPPGIDPNSPQFQAAQTTCEHQVKHALGLP